LCPLERHSCQYWIISGGLKTCSSRFPLKNSARTIACTLAVCNSIKMPIRWKAKVFFVVCQITYLKSIFIMLLGSITDIYYFFCLRNGFLYLLHQFSLHNVNCRYVVACTIWKEDQTFMENFNIILVIENYRVYCTLIVVVVECLGGILNNESEILRKIGMHQDFTFLQILSHVSYMRRLIFRKKWWGSRVSSLLQNSSTKSCAERHSFFKMDRSVVCHTLKITSDIAFSSSEFTRKSWSSLTCGQVLHSRK